MRRTERLFQIIQILRRHRAPVTGQVLAAELEVSLRTLYRDMAELIAQRVPIRGEAGTGYVLDTGYDMPPLMLPFLIAYSEDIRMVCAWCELRQDFRHFRTDRVKRQEMLEERFPERVATLRKSWKDQREKLRT